MVPQVFTDVMAPVLFFSSSVRHLDSLLFARLVDPGSQLCGDSSGKEQDFGIVLGVEH